MNSAHRSSESAHRSGGPELKTEIFIVKTPHDQDAVIVSFVEDGENNGIFLYEPGADPVELDAVDIDGTADEFEYATVSATSGTLGTADYIESEWPGDGMVTRAERDAAVDAATEDHANLRQAYDTLRDQAQALETVVRQWHTDDARGHSLGAWSLCSHPVCQATQAVEL